MLTREKYKKIKALNKQQLDEYLDGVFIQGYNSGVIAMSSALTDKIDAGIRKTPGIGEKRYQEIMKNIAEELHKADKPVSPEEVT